MSFANHNILDIALSIIPPTVVQIRKNTSSSINKFGQSEGTYSEWIDVYGIVQPGGQQNEHVNGVDFSKNHVTIWLRGVALDGTHIQWKPDQIRFMGGVYNVVGVKDWFPYDNYRECDCVEAMNTPESQAMTPATQPPQNALPPKPDKKIIRRRISKKVADAIAAKAADSEESREMKNDGVGVVNAPVIFAPQQPCESEGDSLDLNRKTPERTRKSRVRF